jgi:hypothetical protein
MKTGFFTTPRMAGILLLTGETYALSLGGLSLAVITLVGLLLAGLAG